MTHGDMNRKRLWTATNRSVGLRALHFCPQRGSSFETRGAMAMRTIKHPLSGALYDLDDDGNIA